MGYEVHQITLADSGYRAAYETLIAAQAADDFAREDWGCMLANHASVATVDNRDGTYTHTIGFAMFRADEIRTKSRLRRKE